MLLPTRLNSMDFAHSAFEEERRIDLLSLFIFRLTIRQSVLGCIKLIDILRVPLSIIFLLILLGKILTVFLICASHAYFAESHLSLLSKLALHFLLSLKL
jgi:hypothetical protein